LHDGAPEQSAAVMHWAHPAVAKQRWPDTAQSVGLPPTQPLVGSQVLAGL